MKSTYRKSHKPNSVPSKIIVNLPPTPDPLSVANIADWMRSKHQQDPEILLDTPISVGRITGALPWEITKLARLVAEYARQHGLKANLHNVKRIESGMRTYRDGAPTGR